jgi:serine/threonine protein kinase
LVSEDTIASGGNGCIYKVRDKDTKKEYALKVTRKPKLGLLRKIYREVEILKKDVKKLDYGFLVKPAENCFFEDVHNIYLVMEYYEYCM